MLQSVIARQTGTSFKNKSYGKDQVRANKRAIVFDKLPTEDEPV